MDLDINYRIKPPCSFYLQVGQGRSQNFNEVGLRGTYLLRGRIAYVKIAVIKMLVYSFWNV